MNEEPPKPLGIRASARRVQRSRRTIHRWLRQGMPSYMIEGHQYILESDLLAHYRSKLLAKKASYFRKRI